MNIRYIIIIQGQKNTETPLEMIPGFEAYSAIIGILSLVLIFKIKRNR